MNPVPPTYEPLDIEAGAAGTPASPRHPRCSALGQSALRVAKNAATYCLNAFSLTVGAGVGMYCAVYVMTKIAPIALHVSIDLPNGP